MTKPHVTIYGAELRVINAIANRAIVFFPDREWRDIKMDLIACHTTTPLRLNELLDARDSDFVHDVAGIERYLDHQTFQLRDCFRPRFAMPR